MWRIPADCRLNSRKKEKKRWSAGFWIWQPVQGIDMELDLLPIQFSFCTAEYQLFSWTRLSMLPGLYALGIKWYVMNKVMCLTSLAKSGNWALLKGIKTFSPWLDQGPNIHLFPWPNPSPHINHQALNFNYFCMQYQSEGRMTTHRSLLQCRPQELIFPVKKCFSALGNPIVLVLSQEIF